jgi:DNA invertase Pin-like site-specific DNA recombinase
MPVAYSYLRFSTPDQFKGDSFRRQTEMARQYAATHGLELDSKLTLQDLGVSAFRGRNHRTGALRAFLDAVEAGMVEEGSCLLVESLDRLSRDAIVEAHGLFLLIVNAGVTVVTLSDGKAYSRAGINANPMDLLYSLLIFIRGNEESATKARRIRAVWGAKRDRAAEKVMTSRAPGWLRLVNGQWEVIEDRAAVVRRIFDDTCRGIGQHAIAERLNREGVPVFGRGQRWHRSYIVKILASPAVVGTLVPHTLDYGDGRRVRRPLEPVENYYPVVITTEQAAAARAMAPPRGRHSDRTPQNVLGTLARCPLCASSMTRVNKGNGTKGGRPKFVCTRAKVGDGCTYHTVDYEQVESALVQGMARAVAEAPAGSGEIAEKLAQVEANISGGTEQLEELLDAVAAGELRDSPALAQRIRNTEAAIDALEDRRRELKQEVEASASPIVRRRLSALVDAFAVPLDVARANGLLRQAARGVTVDYPNGVLLIDWRHGGQSQIRYTINLEGRR